MIVYFGFKENLTNEDGVFDVDRAQSLVLGEDPELLAVGITSDSE